VAGGQDGRLVHLDDPVTVDGDGGVSNDAATFVDRDSRHVSDQEHAAVYNLSRLSTSADDAQLDSPPHATGPVWRAR